jgi:hypothetical protein
MKFSLTDGREPAESTQWQNGRPVPIDDLIRLLHHHRFAGRALGEGFEVVAGREPQPLGERGERGLQRPVDLERCPVSFRRYAERRGQLRRDQRLLELV